MRAKEPAGGIDEYIAGFPLDVRAILRKVRTTIRRAAPRAEERISYGIPTFQLDGNLIHFAAFKSHIGIYPAPRGAPAFRKEFAAYEGGKGTVRFSLDEPIPYGLIRRIVKYRVAANRPRAAGLAKKKPAKKKLVKKR